MVVVCYCFVNFLVGFLFFFFFFFPSSMKRHVHFLESEKQLFSVWTVLSSDLNTH